MILSIPARQVANILVQSSLHQRVRRATTRSYNHSGEHEVAKKTTSKRKEDTTDDVKAQGTFSQMKRSEGSSRQKARALGLG